MRPLTVSKREPKRSRVFLIAHVDGGNGPVEARIRDISRTGALLEAETTLKAGGHVRLGCGDTHLDARVAWVDKGCFGLEFVTPLLVGKLIDASGTKLGVSAPRAYRRSDYN